MNGERRIQTGCNETRSEAAGVCTEQFVEVVGDAMEGKEREFKASYGFNRLKNNKGEGRCEFTEAEALLAGLEKESCYGVVEASVAKPARLLMQGHCSDRTP
jgi:hypothetical protein